MEDLEQYYDKLAPEYDGAYTLPVDQEEDALHSKVFRRWVKPDDFVLDVGCGTGKVLEWIRPKYYLGVDPSPGMIEVARRKWPGRTFARTRVEDLSFTDHEFDVVASVYEPLAHVEDLAGALQRMAAACRSVVLVSLPLPRHRSRKRLTADAPVRIYRTLPEVVYAFEEAGMDVVGINTFSSWLHDRLPRWALSHTGVAAPRGLAYYVLIEAKPREVTP